MYDEAKRGTDGHRVEDDKADDFNSQKQKISRDDQIALRGNETGVT